MKWQKQFLGRGQVDPADNFAEQNVKISREKDRASDWDTIS